MHEDAHNAYGDAHRLVHELGQPHSHDHEIEDEFTLSYADEAIEHINQDVECCIVGLLETFPDNFSERKPSEAVKSYSNNWSPPFLQHIKPPPKF